MKIYTRTGDDGEADLIGERTKKTDDRIITIGSIDETMAAISTARMTIEDPAITEILLKIEKTMTKIMAIIAGSDKQVKEEEIKKIEDHIDTYPIKIQEFTRPKTEQSAFLDMARTTCRRAEINTHQINCEAKIRSYMNRASDLLHSLSIHLDNEE